MLAQNAVRRKKPTYADSAGGPLGGVEDDEADVVDHLALVVALVPGAAEDVDKDFGSYEL